MVKKASPAKKTNSATQNGLGEAIGYGGFNPFNFPSNQGFPGTEQVSKVDSLFKNLRWYLVSNDRQLLNELYVEIGLVQTIVDLPVDDALRGGITIKSKQLDEEQIEELQNSLKRDKDITTVGQAAKWNRLFGGAGNIILVNDQDPSLPLDVKAIGPNTDLEFRAVDMWELFWTKQNTEGYDPSLQTEDFEVYDYYGEALHKSRVMKMTGLTAPSFIRPKLRGWGFSVAEKLVRSINQYLKGTDLTFEVLDEFKLDVYKIKNLVNTLLSPNGQQKIQQRVQMANWQKNYQNALVMDSEDDFDHKQLSFAGLAEAQEGIRKQVAADMRMPLTKLFGASESAGGIGNADQNDMENYNSMVENEVRSKIEYDLLRVCEIKCQKLFSFVPDDLSIEFQPLRTLTAEQAETVKTQKFTRALQAQQAGLISTLEFRENCNKGDLFDITLDTTSDSLNPDDPEVADIVEEGVNDPINPQDSEDPGTDRADTKKSKVFSKGRAASDNEEPKAVKPDAPEKKTEPKKENGTDHSAEIEKLYAEWDRADDSNNTRKQAEIMKKIEALKADTVKNGVLLMPIAFTRVEKVMRTISNSADFDKASYEADGGDDWIDPRRAPLFENPDNVDEALWAKAKDASQKALGEIRWQFVTWMYKKQGGKF